MAQRAHSEPSTFRRFFRVTSVNSTSISFAVTVNLQEQTNYRYNWQTFISFRWNGSKWDLKLLKLFSTFAEYTKSAFCGLHLSVRSRFNVAAFAKVLRNQDVELGEHDDNRNLYYSENQLNMEDKNAHHSHFWASSNNFSSAVCSNLDPVRGATMQSL